MRRKFALASDVMVQLLQDLRARDPLLWCILVASAAVVLAMHLQVPLVATGDAYAVYFPVVWDLQDGKGLAAFRFLEYGFIRGPGYPLFLYFGTVIAGNLGRAVTLLAVLFTLAYLAPLYALLVRHLGRTAASLACLFMFVSNCNLHMIAAATPDLLCFSALVWSLFLIDREDASKVGGFAAGLLATFAVFCRVNVAFLPVFIVVVVAWRHRRNVLAALVGVGLLLALWSVVSALEKGAAFWLPRGPTEIPVRVFHEHFAPSHDDLRRFFAEDPVGFVLNAAKRGLVAGPIEIARRAAWPIASILALPALWFAFKSRTGATLVYGVLLFLSWLTIAASHFEARYYPVQVAFISAGAAYVVARNRVAVVSAVAIAIVLRATAFDAQMNLHREAAKLNVGVELLAKRAALMRPGCIGIEEVAYRLSAFRMLMRAKGADRVCCCGLPATAAGFLKLKGYGSIDPERTPALTRVTIPAAPETFELYEANTSTRAD